MSVPVDNLVNSVGGLIVSIVAFFVSVGKAFRFVHEGELGIRLRFGRAVRGSGGEPIAVKPGFVLLIPFVDSLSIHHVRQQSYRFPEQRITLKDGLIYKVGGMVIFKVVDVYKALFEIEDVNSSIDDLCMAAIKDELEQMMHEDLSKRDEMSKKLLDRVKERATEWGVEIVQFSLPECAPTPETANLINAGLSVRMRLKALKDGLKGEGLDIQTVSHNLAAVLVGIPLTATVTMESALTEHVSAPANQPDSSVKES